jgi:hypothetical protein
VNDVLTHDVIEASRWLVVVGDSDGVVCEAFPGMLPVGDGGCLDFGLSRGAPFLFDERRGKASRFLSLARSVVTRTATVLRSKSSMMMFLTMGTAEPELTVFASSSLYLT